MSSSDFVFDENSNKATKRSPLYTSKQDAAKKRAILNEKGKDLDGAYRAYGRIDSQKKN